LGVHFGRNYALNRNPFPEVKIHPGPYRIGKHIEDANIYRIGHPLAELIIQKCKAFSLAARELIFDYTGTPKKISIVEPLLRKSGWMIGESLSVSAFETEDHILLYGITDEGVILDVEQCRRLFSLSAKEGGSVDEDSAPKQALKDGLTSQKNTILNEVSTRNGNFFEQELDKLDKWGDDRRNSLKVTLKDLDDQIKELKKQARLAPNLPEKLKIEKERKNIESERDQAWREYDEAAKEIEQNKDRLIDTIEKKLSQNLLEEPLFLIRWQIN